MSPANTTGALDRAFRLLSSRPHSEKEIRVKLATRGYPQEEIEKAVARLMELRYINDEELCPQHAQSRVTKANVGPARLRLELARKGFAEILIEKTVDELYPQAQNELATAFRAAAKKIRTLKPGMDAQAARKKIFDHLLRKGFDMETARKVALDEFDTLMQGGQS